MHGFDVFKKIFHYKSSHSDLSVISSDPVGVCFCFGTDALMPYCCMDSNCKKSVSMYNVTVYPGETFFISALLGNLQGSETINRTNCTTLKYTVFSTCNSETLTLVPEKTNMGFQYETARLHFLPIVSTILHSIKYFWKI